VDCTTANVTENRRFLASGAAAVTDMTYDGEGKLTSVAGPANLNGERYSLAYTYDPVVRVHVESVTDSLNNVRARVDDAGKLGRTGNYAAGRLDNGQIITARSGGDLHAEERLVQQTPVSRRLVEVYWEREPCAFRCESLLRQLNVRTSWSWDWNGPAVDRAAVTREINEAARALFG
jgi:Xanthomonas XOO_2897-like deaminase